MLREAQEQQSRNELAQAAKASPHHPSADAIGAMRKIVADRQAARVGGCYVDMATAAAIVAVHDALSEKNQADFAARPVRQMASIAWRLAK